MPVMYRLADTCERQYRKREVGQALHAAAMHSMTLSPGAGMLLSPSAVSRWWSYLRAIGTHAPGSARARTRASWRAWAEVAARHYAIHSVMVRHFSSESKLQSQNAHALSGTKASHNPQPKPGAKAPATNTPPTEALGCPEALRSRPRSLGGAVTYASATYASSAGAAPPLTPRGRLRLVQASCRLLES
jgi:hypothetical protein